MLQAALHDDVEVIIVIPSYREEELPATLLSLSACEDAGRCEVIVVLNDSEDDGPEVRKMHLATLDDLSKNQGIPGSLCVHSIYISEIARKDAGVGMARRIGMDEALHRFRAAGRQGVIACLDADCTVQSNYITSIIHAFNGATRPDAVSIHFEHADLENPAIVGYELHLRCFIEWQRWLGLPFAFHTVGSSMAVDSEAYAAQGGMNKRKAGEDFYFFHKFTAAGRAGVLHTTAVYPSARPSDRVPFGTGRAVIRIAEGAAQESYASSSYELLRPLLESLYALFRGTDWRSLDLDDSAAAFFHEQNLAGALEEIRDNTTSINQFRKRFFRWLNAFRFMKYMHYMREHGHPDIPVLEAARLLYEHIWKDRPDWCAVDFLIDLREKQRSWTPGLS
jgi:glycosyltransferase involved in cell wall biosynthesis